MEFTDYTTSTDISLGRTYHTKYSITEMSDGNYIVLDVDSNNKLRIRKISKDTNTVLESTTMSSIN